MNRIVLVFASVLMSAVIAGSAFPQAAGNVNVNPTAGASNRRYPAGYERAPATEQVVSEQPNLTVNTFQFIDVRLLTSVPTKTYVALFGLNQEAAKLEEANRRLQDQINSFRQGLSGLGVPPEDVYLDFISQTRTYDFQVKDNVAKEKSAGFQLKQNLAVRYRDRALLDRIVPMAAQNGVFDLIKVDYQTEDLAPVRLRMAEEALRIIKKKEESYAKIGVKLEPVSVAAEAFEAFQPADAYSAYKAFETGSADDNFRVVERRKNSTQYFEPLDPAKFDAVLSPIGFEPQVQCSYHIRVKYLVASHTTVVPNSDGPLSLR